MIDRVPGGECAWNGQFVRFERQVWIRLLKMQVGRNLPMVQGQNGFDQSGNPGSGFEVAQIGFDRTDHTGV